MYHFTEITADKLQLASHVKILKASDYNQYLSAQAIVEAAEKKAADIIQSANDIFLKQKALGYEAGLNQVKENQSQIILKTLEKCREYLINSKLQLTKIVIQAIRKLVGEFDDVELALKITNQAIDSVSNQREIILRVAAEQENDIKARLDDIRQQHPEIIHIEVTADERVEPGGCLLETKIGVIDATLKNQLTAIENSLLKQVNDRA